MKSKQWLYKISNAHFVVDINFTLADWSSFHSSDPEGQTNLDGLSIGNYEQQMSEAARRFDLILSNKRKSVIDVRLSTIDVSL